MEEKDNPKDLEVDKFIQKEVKKYMKAVFQMVAELDSACDYAKKKDRSPTRLMMIALRKASLELDSHSKIFRRNTLKAAGKMRKGRFPPSGYAI